jgi:hypothetical protein
VASRVGAVGGDVVGIAILEHDHRQAVDELVVELPDDHGPGVVDLLLAEILEVDGVVVEHVEEATAAERDPRLDALETAAALVGARSPDDALEALCSLTVRTVGSSWGAVVVLDEVRLAAAEGEAPDAASLVAHVRGSQVAARSGAAADDGRDVVWAPLASARMALVLGRHGTPFRALERRQVAALARIVDTRFRELQVTSSRAAHPSVQGPLSAR